MRNQDGPTTPHQTIPPKALRRVKHVPQKGSAANDKDIGDQAPGWVNNVPEYVPPERTAADHEEGNNDHNKGYHQQLCKTELG